jgi:peptidoglycan hydrolase-like amidase
VAVQSPGGAVNRLEFPNTDSAVRETSGEIRVLSNGSVVRTEFSSSSGEWTAGGAFPAKAVQGSEAPVW